MKVTKTRVKRCILCSPEEIKSRWKIRQKERKQDGIFRQICQMRTRYTGKYLQVACRPLSQIRLTALYSGATMVEKLKCLVGMKKSLAGICLVCFLHFFVFFYCCDIFFFVFLVLFFNFFICVFFLNFIFLNFCSFVFLNFCIFVFTYF